jgi:hypothetical protein
VAKQGATSRTGEKRNIGGRISPSKQKEGPSVQKQLHKNPPPCGSPTPPFFSTIAPNHFMLMKLVFFFDWVLCTQSFQSLGTIFFNFCSVFFCALYLAIFVSPWYMLTCHQTCTCLLTTCHCVETTCHCLETTCHCLEVLRKMFMFCTCLLTCLLTC